MPRFLPFLAFALLAEIAAAPAQASVRGTLHINSGYSDVSSGLLPDLDVNFTESTEPQTLTFQQDFSNTAEPPEVVYSRSATAMMDASEGDLWGYSTVELDGIPPSIYVGIYAKAYLLGIDYFTIDSDVLDDGDPIDVTFRIAVEGNGRVDAQLQVDLIGSGGSHSGVLYLSHPSYASGTFSGVVGGLYKVEYHLQTDGGAQPIRNERGEPDAVPRLRLHHARLRRHGAAVRRLARHQQRPRLQRAGAGAGCACAGGVGHAGLAMAPPALRRQDRRAQPRDALPDRFLRERRVSEQQLEVLRRPRVVRRRRVHADATLAARRSQPPRLARRQIG